MTDETVFEWEKRSDQTSFLLHCLAGSIAGISEHVLMIPFDNVKTHSQVLKEQNNDYWKITKLIYQKGGISNFWQGSSIIAGGSIPAHAAYFSIYEFAKEKFKLQDESIHPFLFGLTGCIATIAHDFIITPFDVIKQRNQVMHNEKARTLFMNMVRNEGFFSLYRSLPITWLMNIPNAAILVGTNETLKRLTRKEQNHTFFSYFFCAGISASFASILTIPLDNIKTKLQTQSCYKYQHFNDFSNKDQQKDFKLITIQEKNLKNFGSTQESINLYNNISEKHIKYFNIKHTVQRILREEGLKGFKKGIFPRVLNTAPSAAISWASYETIKKFFADFSYFNHKGY